MTLDNIPTDRVSEIRRLVANWDRLSEQVRHAIMVLVEQAEEVAAPDHWQVHFVTDE